MIISANLLQTFCKLIMVGLLNSTNQRGENMKRKLFVLSLFAVLALLVTACGSAATQVPAAAPVTEAAVVTEAQS